MIPVLLALLALPLAAQSPARKRATPVPKPTPTAVKSEAFPLVRLVVTGNSRYTAQQVVKASGLKMGQPADNAQFEAARERLLKSGAFESISYQFGPDADGTGIAGTLAVVEVEQLYPFRFEDLPATEAELRAYLKDREPLFETKVPGTKEFLDRVTAELKTFVDSKGFKDAVVAKLTPDGSGGLAVVFRPKTGPPAIGEVKFTGNEVLPNSTLHNAFGLVAIGVPFTEERVRQLLETSIRPLYESRGRLRATFPKMEAKKMQNVDGVSVTVQVAEGPAFKVGKVQALGSSLTSKELLAAAAIKPGEVVNFDEVQGAIDRIQKVFRKDGFMRSETRMERRIDDKEQTVDIDFRSADGPRFFMGKLAIEGLDVTTEPAIRKLWSMSPGKPFNAEYPQFFLDRVRDDGYLENLGRTQFTQEVNEAGKTVDVTLYFRGAPPPPERKRRPGPEL